jgi:hypothetical protein
MTFHPKSNATFLILLLSVAERRKKGGNLGMFFGQILFLLRRNCYEKISKRKKKLFGNVIWIDSSALTHF